MEITREIASKVLETIDAGLVSGLGDPIPGQMCVEAAVCYALGLPHSADPGCVGEALRTHNIALNDKRWSSQATRAAGLRRLGLAQLGSAGVLDGADFVARLVRMTIGKAVPRALRTAARHSPTHADALEVAAVLCEQEPTRASAQAARVAAAAYAASATAYAAVAFDKSLAIYCEDVVQILIEMGAPGCVWLDLAPLT